ncbi:MAG: D-2-hydroxyacid dehydrogenase [Hyphomicrobiales bacterium]|nr:D-2-hydroxyacid dehydrogenase [Hyphomicrobiales bacterium]
MNLPHVVLHMDAPDEALGLVREQFPELSVSTCNDYENLPNHILETGAGIVYSVRFAGTARFPRAALVESDTVRWVSVGGSGTDHLAGWNPKRVIVTNAAGVAADMMAEYTLGALLHFSLGLPGFRKAQGERRWTGGKVGPVEGQTLLIIGMGRTGQAIARRAKAMGMRVLGMRARPAPTPHVDAVLSVSSLHEVLPTADGVAVCVPLLESTRNLLDAEAIARFKEGAVLVDVSRGGVVDQKSLAAALESGRLKGAALDVFETEPLPGDSPFWGMDNVIVTPHCSSVYEGWELKSVSMFCDNLRRYLAGEALDNVVDPERGY